ncbi:Zinc finger-containing ubiquitin peptidase 1 [Verticillium longisporum]|nr:Zinc finger-containing ubiquitin peptidase 1 [Verticillium longisporum]
MPDWLAALLRTKGEIKTEGGFCGYRNIQMLISYIIATGFEGQEHFQGRLPTIFEIQDFIENAWDRGINVQGRVETGGIRGTRKYIGTAEAQALSALPKPSQTRKLASRRLAF